jgi:hypothetical protein
VLAAPRRQVARLLVILRLVEAISVYATVAEAVREVGHFRERARPVPHPPRLRTRTGAGRRPCQARRGEREHGCRWRGSQRI